MKLNSYEWGMIRSALSEKILSIQERMEFYLASKEKFTPGFAEERNKKLATDLETNTNLLHKLCHEDFYKSQE